MMRELIAAVLVAVTMSGAFILGANARGSSTEQPIHIYELKGRVKVMEWRSMHDPSIVCTLAWRGIETRQLSCSGGR